MTFPPLHAPVRALWMPNTLYEPHNPRQVRPLDLYRPDPVTATGVKSTGRDSARARNDQASYAAKRDLVNALRGTTTRMVWDYQTDAATLSEEEHEYEMRLDAARSHGYSWLVPEGKAMNQEAEAEDDAIADEARATAAAAAAQRMREAQAAAQAEQDAMDDVVEVASSRRQARRQAREETAAQQQEAADPAQEENSRSNDPPAEQQQRRRGSGTGSANGTSARMSQSRSASGRAPNSRDSGGLANSTRAPPRASGRYSSGGGSGSAAFPRYGAPSAGTTTNDGPAASTNRGVASGPAQGRSAGHRDLDAEIPEAEEASYSASQSMQLGEGDISEYQGEDLDGDLTNLDELPGAQDASRERQFSRERSFSPSSPYMDDEASALNRQGDENSADMNLTT